MWKRFGVATFVVALLWWYWRKRRSRAYLKRYDYVRARREPTTLVLVVNGFLGSVTSGRDVVDRIYEAREDVVVARVQCSDVVPLLGVNLYSGGAEEAAQHVVEVAKEQLHQHQTLRHISCVGNSFGGLVVRAASAELAKLRELRTAVFLCTPHEGVKVGTVTRVLASVLPNGCVRELCADDGVLAALSTGHHRQALAAYASRQAIGSVHDTTVTLDSAHFGLRQEVDVPTEVPKESVLLKRWHHRALDTQHPLQSLDWTMWCVTGVHDNTTRAWNSRAVIQMVAKTL